MPLELITITPDNIHTAVNENFRRIYAELRNKVPINGHAVLEGNWDFQDQYTVKGATDLGPHSAVCDAPLTDPS